jgi:hypothetical protein
MPSLRPVEAHAGHEAFHERHGKVELKAEAEPRKPLTR